MSQLQCFLEPKYNSRLRVLIKGKVCKFLPDWSAVHVESLGHFEQLFVFDVRWVNEVNLEGKRIPLIRYKLNVVKSKFMD